MPPPRCSSPYLGPPLVVARIASRALPAAARFDLCTPIFQRLAGRSMRIRICAPRLNSFGAAYFFSRFFTSDCIRGRRASLPGDGSTAGRWGDRSRSITCSSHAWFCALGSPAYAPQWCNSPSSQRASAAVGYRIVLPRRTWGMVPCRVHVHSVRSLTPKKSGRPLRGGRSDRGPWPANVSSCYEKSAGRG